MDDIFEPDDDGGYALVMPFVAVVSKGGPYDDEAYVAGFEMGRTDALLKMASEMGLVPDTGLVVHAANAEQVDLMAMRYGFTTETEVVEDNPTYAYCTIKAIIPEDDS